MIFLMHLILLLIVSIRKVRLMPGPNLRTEGQSLGHTLRNSVTGILILQIASIQMELHMQDCPWPDISIQTDCQTIFSLFSPHVISTVQTLNQRFSGSYRTFTYNNLPKILNFILLFSTEWSYFKWSAYLIRSHRRLIYQAKDCIYQILLSMK